MKIPQRRLSLLTLVCLSLLATSCNQEQDQPAAPHATTKTEPIAAQPVPTEPAASTESPEPIADAAAPTPFKWDQPPVRTGSERTFVGTSRARLSMVKQSAYIDWSPDGKWLLVNGPELWSTETGKPVRNLGEAKVAIFHPDGEHVIGCTDKAVLIWELDSGTVVKQIRTEVRADQISCSANGNRLLLLDRHAAVDVCDVDSGRVRRLDRGSLQLDCCCGAISPDGKTLALSGKEGTLVLIDAETLAVKETRRIHQGDVDQITYSPDGKMLATCCDEEKNQTKNMIRIWNATTGERLNEYVCDDSFNQGLRFSRDGTRLLSFGRSLYADDPLGQGNAKSMLDRSGACVDAAVCSPDGLRVAAVTNTDNDIHLFDLTQTGQENIIRFPEYYSPKRLIPLPGMERMVALDYSGPPAIFDPASSEKPVPFGHEFERTPAVSPDGKMLVGADYGKLYWYNLVDGTELRVIEGNFGAATFHPDGKVVLVGNADHERKDFPDQVQEITAATGEFKRVFPGHRSMVTSVAVSSDGRWLASGGGDARVVLFDYQSGKLLHEALAHEGAVSLLRFSPSGEWLVSLGGDQDKNIGLWKIGEPAPRYLDHAGALVIGAVFSPDSKMLVTGDGQGQFRVWDLAGDVSSFTIPSGSDRIVSMDPLPDGDGFIGVCRDREASAKIWKFRDLQRPVASDNLVQKDTNSPEDQKVAAYNGLLARYHKVVFQNQHMAVSPDESLAATMPFSSPVTVWALAEMRAEGTADGNVVTELQRPVIIRELAGPKEGMGRGLAFSQDGQRLMTLIDQRNKADGTLITIWDLSNGKTVTTFKGTGEFGDVASSPATNIVAVTRGFEPDVRLIDLQQNVELPSIPFSDHITALCIDSAGKHLLVGTERRISIIDLATRKVLREQKLGGEAKGIAASTDGKRLVVTERGSNETQLRVYDFNTLQQIVETRKTEVPGFEADFTRDGRYIVMQFQKGSRFYDAQTGELKRTLELRHVDRYFAKDGKTLVGSDPEYEGIDIINWTDLFNDELQATLAKFGPGLQQVSRDGKYHVWKIQVDGRLSRELLGKLKQVTLPLKLDLSDSDNLTAEDFALLEGHPQIYGVRLPVRCPDSGLKSLATLENLVELEILSPSEEMITALSAFPKLRVLNLGRPEAAPEKLDALKQLQNLEVLHLELKDNQVPVAMKAVVQLPQLKTLYLQGKLTNEELAGLAQLPKLQGLAWAPSFGEDLEAKVAILAKFEKIKELAIDRFEFNDTLLRQLKDMKNLEGLNLYSTGFKEADTLLEFKSLKWVIVPHDSQELLEKLRRQLPRLRSANR